MKYPLDKELDLFEYQAIHSSGFSTSGLNKLIHLKKSSSNLKK